MDSLFVAGTDTDVGKTYVAAGLAGALRQRGVDVGVIKPFAAGTAQESGFKSLDAQVLRDAAGSTDPEILVNPQFFSMAASPYTASKSLGVTPDIGGVVSSYQRLAMMHSVVLVEGMGGVMTPLHKDYSMADLAAALGIPAIIVTRTRIGTINHTILAVMACRQHKIPVKGIVINGFDEGYDADGLADDLAELTGINVLGAIPHIPDITDPSVPKLFEKNLDIDALLR